jgi:hypothetical protein
MLELFTMQEEETEDDNEEGDDLEMSTIYVLVASVIHVLCTPNSWSGQYIQKAGRAVAEV